MAMRGGSSAIINIQWGKKTGVRDREGESRCRIPDRGENYSTGRLK